MVPENHKDSRTIYYGLVLLEVVAESSTRGTCSKGLVDFPTIQQHHTDGDEQQDHRNILDVLLLISLRIIQLVGACQQDSTHNKQGNTSQKGENSNIIHFLSIVKEIIFFL